MTKNIVKTSIQWIAVQHIIFLQFRSHLLSYQISYQSPSEKKKPFLTIFSQSCKQPCQPCQPSLLCLSPLSSPPAPLCSPRKCCRRWNVLTAIFISAQDNLFWMLQTSSPVSQEALIIFPSIYYVSCPSGWSSGNVTLTFWQHSHSRPLALGGVISNWITSSIISRGDPCHFQEPLPQDLLDFCLVWVYVSVLKTERIPVVPITSSSHNICKSLCCGFRKSRGK